MDRRQLMFALQSGLPAVEEASDAGSSSGSVSPVLRSAPHPVCCGTLMAAGEGERTLRCTHCARVQYEEAPARGTRRSNSETRRAGLINELVRYNRAYANKHAREIPFEQLQQAADLFILCKEKQEFRDAPNGSHRNSILASILVYVCKGRTNFVESDVLEFLRVGGVTAKIQFSKGERVLRDMYNKNVEGVDLNVDHTRQLLRGNLLFLDLVGPTCAYTLPLCDLEQAGYRVLELSEELTIEPGVQPKTRTLGIIWFLVRRLQARGFCQELKLRDIKVKCKIGDATIINFQRALENEGAKIEPILIEFGIAGDGEA